MSGKSTIDSCSRYILDCLKDNINLTTDKFSAIEIGNGLRYLMKKNFVSKLSEYKLTKRGLRRADDNDDQLELF